MAVKSNMSIEVIGAFFQVEMTNVAYSLHIAFSLPLTTPESSNFKTSARLLEDRLD
jgi:hypothetical protein